MISFVIPSIGRPSLAKTLASIETWPGDEILVIGSMGEVVDPRVRLIPCEPGGDWGHTERNLYSHLATGTHVAHIDDDDCYTQGHRVVMEDAISKTPNRPVLFKMRYPNGFILWREPQVCLGNVGTPMMLIPNEPEKFGAWGSFHGGDCHFLETMAWKRSDIVWRSDVIVRLGHDDPNIVKELAAVRLRFGVRR